MEYSECLKLLSDIERDNDVDSIKYHNISVWCYLRIYIIDQLSSRNNEIRLSKSSIRTIISGLFSYPFRKWLKPYDFWVLTSVERRKLVDGFYIQRISGVFNELSWKTLFIEKPVISKPHYKKKKIREQYIVSFSLEIVLAQIISKFLKLERITIENVNLLDQLLGELGISLDYRHYLRLLNAHRIASNLIISLCHIPKVVFIECPHSSMGFVWALHSNKIRVVELQHGVINESHDAYNSASYDKVLTPDAIWVYGKDEVNYFKNRAYNYTSEIYTTGLYILDYVDRFSKVDVFYSIRQSYSKVIVASGQPQFEDIFLDYIIAAARGHKDYKFIYIPRYQADSENLPDNVSIVCTDNIYDYLKWCDIHMTIFSTTCIEAEFFNKPTIFYNYHGLSKVFWSDLENEKVFFFANGIEEFDQGIEYIQNAKIDGKQHFVGNTKVCFEEMIFKELSNESN